MIILNMKFLNTLKLCSKCQQAVFAITWMLHRVLSCNESIVQKWITISSSLIIHMDVPTFNRLSRKIIYNIDQSYSSVGYVCVCYNAFIVNSWGYHNLRFCRFEVGLRHIWTPPPPISATRTQGSTEKLVLMWY